jgi:cold shock CspA family protein
MAAKPVRRSRTGATARGTVAVLRPDFGVGGVGYILDEEGIEHFFHSRFVRAPGYAALRIGASVEFKRIRAKKAMGAGAQARDVHLLVGK